MKIIWLSHFVPWPPSGGALQRSYHLLRQAAVAHDVHLVALSQGALLAAAEIPRAQHELSFCSAVEVFPIPSEQSRLHWAGMMAAGLLRTTPYDVNWLDSRAMRARVNELAQRGDADLVHVDTLGLMPYADLFRGKPRVLNHHNAESHMMERRASLERSWPRRGYFHFEARRLARLERRACPSVEMNVVVSALDADRLRSVVGDVPIAVVENGVDLDYFRAEGAADAHSLVFVGGMDWYPNRPAVASLVREIWPRLVAASPQWRLTVVGRQPSVELREAAAVDPRISAPGFVPDIRPYVSAAGIYVCPIHDGGGTRLKVLDALAMGKAIVATRLAVEGIAVEEGVHYLGAQSTDEFVDQIRRLADSAELRETLGRNARAFVEKHFGWDQIGGRLLRCYESATSLR